MIPNVSIYLSNQALSSLAVQPLLLWNARISQNANRPLLLLMIPATLVATPLGQLTSEHIDKTIVQGVGGVLVTLIALFELCGAGAPASRKATAAAFPAALSPLALSPPMLSSPVLERLLCLRIPILTPSASSHTHCSARPPTSPLAPPCTLVHLPPARSLAASDQGLQCHEGNGGDVQRKESGSGPR